MKTNESILVVDQALISKAYEDAEVMETRRELERIAFGFMDTIELAGIDAEGRLVMPRRPSKQERAALRAYTTAMLSNPEVIIAFYNFSRAIGIALNKEATRQ
jgi:hypothetical protein